MKKTKSCELGRQQNFKIQDLKLDQLVVFQFRKIDKFKIYAHARNSAVPLKLFTFDKYLLGLYIPPKKLEDGNVFLDRNLLGNYIAFIDRIRLNSIKCFVKIYNEKYFLDFTV